MWTARFNYVKKKKNRVEVFVVSSQTARLTAKIPLMLAAKRCYILPIACASIRARVLISQPLKNEK